jgi:hypothetical protein
MQTAWSGTAVPKSFSSGRHGLAVVPAAFREDFEDGPFRKEAGPPRPLFRETFKELPPASTGVPPFGHL